MSNKVPYQKSPTVLKTKRSSRKWVGIFVFEIIGVIIGFIVSALFAMIPVFGWIITIFGIIIDLGIIFGAIKHLFRTALAHAVLTETGIRGRDMFGKGFKLSFENIVSIQQSGDDMTIKTNIKKLFGGLREYPIQQISNADLFVSEYKNARKNYKAGSIEVDSGAEESIDEENK